MNSTRARLARLALVAVLSAGCYTLQPMTTAAPTLGMEFALDINDQGRVALGGQMGPEIRQIEGRLVSSQNGEYEVAVTRVAFMRGGEQGWTGEKVRVRSEYVSQMYEKKLSKGRSVAAGAVGLGGILFFVTRTIRGGGSGENPVGPVDTAHSQRRPGR